MFRLFRKGGGNREAVKEPAKFVFLVGLEHQVARLAEANVNRSRFGVVRAHDMDHALELARTQRPTIVIVSYEGGEDEFRCFVLLHRRLFDDVTQTTPFEKSHFINLGSAFGGNWGNPFGGFSDDPTAPAVVTPIFPRKRRY